MTFNLLVLFLSCQNNKKSNSDKLVKAIAKDTVYCQERISDSLVNAYEVSMYNEKYTTTIKIYDLNRSNNIKELDSTIVICSEREATIKLIKKNSNKLIFDIEIGKDDLINIPGIDSIENYVINKIDTRGMARTNSLFYDIVLLNKGSGLKYHTQIGLEYLEKKRLGEPNFWSQLGKYVPGGY